MPRTLLEKLTDEGIHTEHNYRDPLEMASEHCPTEYFEGVEQPQYICYMKNKEHGFESCVYCWLREVEDE